MPEIPVAIIISILALGVSLWVGYYSVVSARDRIRKDFFALQPDVRIVSAPVMSVGGAYTVMTHLHNLGSSTAYDATITMDGWTGEAHAHIVHPLRPGHNEYEVSLPLGLDAPIRTTLIQDAKARLRYRDRWYNWSEVVYPVRQTPRDDGRFNISIRMEQPTLRRPGASLRKMRKYLRESPSP